LSYFVKVMRGRELLAKDSNGLSDPYATLRMKDCKDVQTRVEDKTLSPVWEETFFYTQWVQEETLTISLFDRDHISDDFLGTVVIPCPGSDGLSEVWLPLLDKKGKDKLQGEVLVETTPVETAQAPAFATPEIANEEVGILVLEIIDAVGLPKYGAGFYDPYVRVRLVSASGAPKGIEQTTPVVRNCRCPSWHSYLPMGQQNSVASGEGTERKTFALEAGDEVQFELMDFENVLNDAVLDRAAVHVSSFTGGSIITVAFPKLQQTCLRLRRVREASARSATIFLVRHGESAWNRAQADKDVLSMLAFDHPLEPLGVQQAKMGNAQWKETTGESQLNRSLTAGELAFTQVSAAFSSPLTRAVQTACLYLEDHPVLKRGPMRLLSSVREIKGIGGLDTVGKGMGKGVEVRARATLASPDAFPEQTISPYTAEGEWWTAMSDDSAAVQDRFEELLNTIEFATYAHAADDVCLHNDEEASALSQIHSMCPHRPTGSNATVAIVGHSLYFKKFLRTFLRTELRDLHPELLQKKLANAACLRVQMDLMRREMIEVELMFGSKLAE
jgi:hypothetical protein